MTTTSVSDHDSLKVAQRSIIFLKPAYSDASVYACRKCSSKSRLSECGAGFQLLIDCAGKAKCLNFRGVKPRRGVGCAAESVFQQRVRSKDGSAARGSRG